MNVFFYRLLVDVRWRNANLAMPNITEYADKLWNEMSEREREVASSSDN